MTQRGRKPASLSLLPSVDGRPERLRPPPDLTETEHQAFLDLVTSCDERRFLASDMPLLAAYARAIVADKTAARERGGQRQAQCVAGPEGEGAPGNGGG
jgi:hypothetical protein